MSPVPGLQQEDGERGLEAWGQAESGTDLVPGGVNEPGSASDPIQVSGLGTLCGRGGSLEDQRPPWAWESPASLPLVTGWGRIQDGLEPEQGERPGCLLPSP